MANYQQFELLKKSAVTKIASDLDQQTANRLQGWENTRTYDTAYSFEDGFTIGVDERQKVALFDGEWYRWDGALPKTVPVGSAPQDEGGIGTGAWLSVGDAALRRDLANPDMGAAMVARGVVAVDSIADLMALPAGQLKADLTYLVSQFWDNTGIGGGAFKWNPYRAKSDHTGGTVIDPGRLTELGSIGEFGNYFQPVANGWGCFERMHLGGYSTNIFFGFVPDNPAVDAGPPTQAAIDDLYKRCPAGGALLFMPGKHTWVTPVNAYNNVRLDFFGDPSSELTPRTVIPRISFIGQPGTVFVAPENGYIIDYYNVSPDAFYELDAHNINFAGTNRTGRPININRTRAFPVRLKFYQCNFRNFEFGMVYEPLKDGGSNPRNGFIGFHSCYIGNNHTGLRTNGIDNVFLSDTIVQSNTWRGLNITTCTVLNMVGGKLQYNGHFADDTSCQAAFSGINRNINIQTYWEGGASTTAANNAGKNLASIIVDDQMNNLNLSGSYFNGLKSSNIIRSTYGKINGINLSNCHFLNYQLKTGNRLIDYFPGSTGTFNELNLKTDSIVIQQMYDSSGAALDSKDVIVGVLDAISVDAVKVFQPNGRRGILQIYTYGETEACGMVAYSVTSPVSCSLLGAGTSLAATTGVLTGTTGEAGKVTISAAADGNIYIENRLVGGGRSVSVRELFRV